MVLGRGRHALLEESTGDGIYDLGGNPIRDDGGRDERFIGTQGEVVLTYEFNRNLNALLSYFTVLSGRFHRRHRAKQDHRFRRCGDKPPVLSAHLRICLGRLTAPS
jgi:hypothetical protein